jgi:hypothetical protein
MSNQRLCPERLMFKQHCLEQQDAFRVANLQGEYSMQQSKHGVYENLFQLQFLVSLSEYIKSKADLKHFSSRYATLMP